MQSSPIPTPVRESKLRAILEGALYFGSAFLLAIIIQTYIARPFIVNGQSMDPTFKNREYLIVDEISYRLRAPQRGEVVVFKAPPTPDKFFIKRIIGLPGETVRISNGKVTIINETNPKGFTLSEPFLKHTDSTDVEVTVPEDHYFVMGDNRGGSYDSRMWGPLPEANLRGRAFVRLLPLTRIDYKPGDVSYE